MKTRNAVFATLLLFAASLVTSFAASIDTAAAQAQLMSNKCNRCHATDKEKVGPALTTIAKKYEGKKDAENNLYKLLTFPTVIEVDGAKEEHKIVKPADESGTRNLVRWILSLNKKS